MLRLWNDPSNRLSHIEGGTSINSRRALVMADGSTHEVPVGTQLPQRLLSRGTLLVEPLHQVHDALCGQWPQFVREWGRKKVREWFQNPLTIASTTLTIPFDGAYGPSWGEQPNPL